MRKTIFFDATLYITSENVSWETRIPSLFTLGILDPLDDEIKENIVDAMLTPNTPPDRVLEIFADASENVLWEAASIFPVPVKIRIFIENSDISSILLA